MTVGTVLGGDGGAGLDGRCRGPGAGVLAPLDPDEEPDAEGQHQQQVHGQGQSSLGPAKWRGSGRVRGWSGLRIRLLRHGVGVEMDHPQGAGRVDLGGAALLERLGGRVEAVVEGACRPHERSSMKFMSTSGRARCRACGRAYGGPGGAGP